MKSFRLFALLFLFLFAQFTAFGHDTHDTGQIQQLVSTNATQIMVEILSGVKSEGGKIYSTTKEALSSAYESVKAEAPEVVREFIIWHVVQAASWLFFFAGVSGVFLYGASRCGKASAVVQKGYGDHYEPFNDNYCIWKWVLRVVGLAILISTLQVNLLTIGQATLAKRIFIIEYVARAVQSAVHTNNY